MKPRFPLSHRACCQRPKEETTGSRVKSKKEGGLPTAIIHKKPRPTPQFLVVATPQF